MGMRAVRKAAIHKARVRWLCAGDAESGKALVAARRYFRVLNYCIRRHGQEA